MSIKSSQTLVSEALKIVKTISPNEALKLSNENLCNLIDVKDKLTNINNRMALDKELNKIKKGSIIYFGSVNSIAHDLEFSISFNFNHSFPSLKENASSFSFEIFSYK